MSVRKRQWTTAAGEAREAWVADYVDQHGARRLKTFKRKKDADAFASTTHVEVREGTHVAESATITVAEAGKEWLATGTNDHLERTTMDQRRQHLEIHIVPFIGREKLSKITVPVVRSFQDRLRTEGRSPAMVKRITVSLGSILAEAQELGYVTRNAVREMSRQRRKVKGKQEKRQKAKLKAGVHIPTPAEIRAIIENSKGRWRPLLLTAIFVGLRASELRGLKWADVDFDRKELHVRQRADRYKVIGMPKSDASQRTVPLPPLVINTLREWKLACPKSEHGLVFPTGDGNVEYHVNIVERGLKPTMIAAGLTVPVMDGSGKPIVDEDGNPIVQAKYTGLHALRHFYASWCINRRAEGGLELPAKIVQARLGHSSITMTMDVYGHLFPRGDDQEELAAAERALLSAVSAT